MVAPRRQGAVIPAGCTMQTNAPRRLGSEESRERPDQDVSAHVLGWYDPDSVTFDDQRPTDSILADEDSVEADLATVRNSERS